MIRVLVVEDSRIARALLVHILESDPEIQVIGSANDGEEALAALERGVPDVMVMDINMPRMNGLEATRKIMETRPVPIVIASASWNPQEVEKTFRAMDAGAVAVVEKPRGIGHPDHDRMAKELVRTVRLMSEVKVVRRWPRLRRAETMLPAVLEKVEPASDVRLVAMGASTGGPPVLQTILAGLSEDFPVPLLVVHHIAPGFLLGLVEWLDQTTPLRVSVGSHGERPLPGHAYFAPDGFQMGLDKEGRIALTGDEPEHGLRPSISYLFRAVASTIGRNAVGVLLTGMGKDGSAELKLMRDCGAITIAQDKETSTVHGMPGEAIRLGGATHVLPPDRIAATISRLAYGTRPVSQPGIAAIEVKADER